MMFKKAQPEQAALKLGVYGPTGSGKTFTGLLIAEGLANRYGGRIAFIDTERGTDFYAQNVPDRHSHPHAFDFDCIYTRAVTEIVKELRGLKYPEHCVICIDSVTHLWEACIAAYRGPKTRAGTIPMHAWSGIKRPYKDLMHFLLNCRQHVIFMGRQTSEWGEDAEGETVQTGVKMRAEGETPYEPHILIRMEPVKPRTADGKKVLKNEVAIPTAFVEKDRTGILAGKLIEWPDYQKVAVPLLSLLGAVQAKVQSDDEAGAIDAANAPKDPVKPKQTQAFDSTNAPDAELVQDLERTLRECISLNELETCGGLIALKKDKLTDRGRNYLAGVWRELKAKLPVAENMDAEPVEATNGAK